MKMVMCKLFIRHLLSLVCRNFSGYHFKWKWIWKLFKL